MSGVLERFFRSVTKVEKGTSEGFSGEKVVAHGDAWDILYDALGSGHVLSGTVSGVEKNGDLVVFIDSVRGIIPSEEIGEPRYRNLSRYVGTGIFFKVIACDRASGTARLSRKAALEEMSRETWAELERDCAELRRVQEELRELKESNGISSDTPPGKLPPEVRERLRELGRRARQVGPVRTATVRSVYRDGAHVDIGGVAAYLPVEEISWERLEDAREVLRPGQSMDVRVVRVDPEASWVRVSLRALRPDPWDTAHSRYSRGGIYRAVVRRYTSRGGLVVELEPGITSVCARPAFGLPKPGTVVKFYLSRLDVERRRVYGTVIGEASWAG